MKRGCARSETAAHPHCAFELGLLDFVGLVVAGVDQLLLDVVLGHADHVSRNDGTTLTPLS